MRKVHGHEYGAHDPKEKATHYDKEDQVDSIELSADNEIVTVPYVIFSWIFPVYDGHHDLINDTCDPSPEASVENACKSIDVSCNYANSLIC